MSNLICPFCGSATKTSGVEMEEGLITDETGTATFAWEDSGETAYERNIHAYTCVVNPEHLFFVPA